MSLSPVFVLYAAVALIAYQAAADGNDVDQRVDYEASENSSKDDITGHPIYEFVYEVGQPKKTDGGNRMGFGHKESRDGSRTWGTYFLELSDGRLQTVKYWVDQTGYHAEVEYAGKPLAESWEEDGAIKAKRERLVPLGQRLQQQQQRTRAGEDQSLVQALLESFPKQSLQTKRSSDESEVKAEIKSPVAAPPRHSKERSVESEANAEAKLPVAAPPRPSTGRSSAARQNPRPVPVNAYATRGQSGGRSRSNRSRSRQSRRLQTPEEST